MARKRRKYTLEFKQEAVRLVKEEDMTYVEVGRDLGVREFQRHAKLRLASLFAGSPEGSHRWATLLGVVRTAQKCDVDVMAYLIWLFERRGSHKQRFGLSAEELTPMAYRAQATPYAQAA